MSSDTKGAGIKDDYAQQIAGDLSANQNAQDRVRSELQRLQEELSQLEDNSKILLKMQDALGVPAKSAKSATTAAAAKRSAKRAAVPSARKASPAAEKSAEKAVEKTAEKAGEKAGEKAVPAKSAAPAKVSRSRTAKAAAKPAAAKKDTVGPSWLELVTAVFAGQSEPRSAAEVTDSLTTTHPDRKVQAAVIRNTLEQGVARGLLERSKQGRSVYYLPTASPAAPAESAPTGPLK
ncbi:hypothetical protein [Streptomyces sp. NPDC059949]|uniref:hypothetical protein n=1 Tax=Streptomyces sp. NPDC059949 TaxID=3347013 RepID=UPI0036629556